MLNVRRIGFIVTYLCPTRAFERPRRLLSENQKWTHNEEQIKSASDHTPPTFCAPLHGASFPRIVSWTVHRGWPLAADERRLTLIGQRPCRSRDVPSRHEARVQRIGLEKRLVRSEGSAARLSRLRRLALHSPGASGFVIEAHSVTSRAAEPTPHIRTNLLSSPTDSSRAPFGVAHRRLKYVVKAARTYAW